MYKKTFVFLLSIVLFIAGCGNTLKSDTKIEPRQSTNAETAPAKQDPPAKLSSQEFLKVHFIDVGQGDSILIQTPSGQAILVDGGTASEGQAVINYKEHKTYLS